MSQSTYRMRRRVGGALLAGVTALGVAAVAGGGVAAAAITGASGTLASGATVGTLLPTQTTPTAVGDITLTFAGTPATNDTVTLTALPNGGACTTTNNVAWNTITGPAAVSPVTATSGWTLTGASAGSCGTATNVLTLTATGTSPSSTITLTGLDMTSTGASAGAVVIDGAAHPGGTGNIPFTVASDATVQGVTVTPSTPLSSTSTSTNNQSIGTITLTSPSVGAISTGNTVCVALSSGTFDAINGVPTVTQTNGAATQSNGQIVTAGSVQLGTSANTIQNSLLSFLVTGTAVSSPPVFTISGIHVDTTSTAGTVTATVAASTSGPSGCAAATSLGSGTVFTVGSATAPIYGQNPSDTTAAEFDNAFVKASNSGQSVTYNCYNNGNAVIATSADPYDALAASYLESQLGTGVLLTSPTSLDASTLAELQRAGVQRVYVVGGLLAVDQNVLNTLSSTPAYQCGGLTKTGSNIQVFSGISGQTAIDTAVAIDNYITATPQNLPSIASAYSNEAAYNQTTGNETAAAPAAGVKTAIVVSSSDYQDAATAAGIAFLYHVPVVLTDGAALSSQAQAELTKLGVGQAIVLGGQLAIQPAVVSSIQAMNISVLRIAGYDYTQTAADLALFEGTVLGWKNQTVYAAQGAGWSDSLGAAALSAQGPAGQSQGSGAVLLTEGPTKGVGQYTDAVLKTAGTPPNGLGGGVTTSLQVLGGPLAVTAAQTTEMQNALSSGA